jgi:hypothetical protein
MDLDLDLHWHRDRPGYYFTDKTGATEFVASARRESNGEWTMFTYTFGMILTSASFRTLAEAKAKAEAIFRSVEVAAR